VLLEVLGALAAGAEMAEHLGEADTAAEYRALFLRGKEWTDRHLFNGEYYQQQIDLTDRGILAAYEGSDAGETGVSVPAPRFGYNACAVTFGDGGGVVGAAVVNDDDFLACDFRIVCRFRDITDDFRDGTFFVKDWDDD